MKCLDPRGINPQERHALLDLFDEIQTQPFPSLLCQLNTLFELRRKIDVAFLNIIGIEGKDQVAALEKMRKVTLERIESMKETMQGD